jgi:hypothetical protein
MPSRASAQSEKKTVRMDFKPLSFRLALTNLLQTFTRSSFGS